MSGRRWIASMRSNRSGACEDAAVTENARRPTNPPGVRVGAAPTIRVANKAIILREGQLLVTVNSGSFPTFYLCPGGGQEHGEDAHAGLRRECREEIGCDVLVGDLAFLRDYIGATHEFAHDDGWFHQREAYFFCELEAGSEPRFDGGGDVWQSGIAWLPVEGLLREPLWPKALARWLAAPEPERARYLGNVN